ncbi:MAG: DegT/DnrJ/EryC1/StrS family aminotransferase [Candidatus Brocadiaceae bacterium]|nr:DegT/DnrJ/EryC1/StrS family aminotransferase [Candidatus Brocadiaceae bacterium]
MAGPLPIKKIPHSLPTLEKEELEMVMEVLSSNYIAQGPKVEALERVFKDYMGVEYALATNSGSSALHLLLLAMGIGTGDEVLVPSYVCAAVLNPILYVGATPRVVDIDGQDLNISLKEVRKKTSPKTKALIVVHTFGQSADINSLLELEIPIIEDCAHSLGGSYPPGGGRRLGSLGTASIFSFYATKMIATGHGGMLASNSCTLMEKARDLREYDEREDYQVRYNYRMTDIEAAMGLSQMRKLDYFILRRREIAATYDRILKDYGLEIPYRRKGSTHAFYRYVLKTRRTVEETIKSLDTRGVESKRPVFKPLHQYLHLDNGGFPNAEEAHRTIVSIPIYPSLSQEQVEYVARNVGEVFSGS